VLSVVSLALGVISIMAISWCLVTFLVRVAQHLFGRRLHLVLRYLGLLVATLLAAAFWFVLFASQPVEWPWAPSSIPVYLGLLALCLAGLRIGVRLEQSRVPTIPPLD
jgi:hypothetical protein